MTATELKAKLLGVLDEVSDGAEVEITKHGRTVARLVPARRAGTLRDMFAGQVVTHASEEELLSPIPYEHFTFDVDNFDD